jgi:hypothetical protein
MREGTIDGVESDAPISAWELLDSFDTADKCRAGKEKNIIETRQMAHQIEESLPPDKVSQNVNVLHGVAAIQARCFASDDPRLKGK